MRPPGHSEGPKSQFHPFLFFICADDSTGRRFIKPRICRPLAIRQRNESQILDDGSGVVAIESRIDFRESLDQGRDSYQAQPGNTLRLTLGILGIIRAYVSHSALHQAQPYGAASRANGTRHTKRATDLCLSLLKSLWALAKGLSSGQWIKTSEGYQGSLRSSPFKDLAYLDT